MPARNNMLLLIAAIFVVGVSTGFLLKSQKKPYPVLLLTIHKLILLSGGIGLGFLIFSKNKYIQMDNRAWILFGAAAASFLIMVISGGLVSIEKEMPAFVKIAHKVFPYITIILTLLIFFSAQLL